MIDRYDIEQDQNGRWRVVDVVMGESKLWNLPREDAVRISQNWNSQIRSKETI